MSNYACIPYIITREFDDQGNLLAFGRIETYQAGTTIPLETYADAGGFASNLNPVVLDASGSANIFLKGQAYKFVFRDADGNLIRTIDDVLGTASASGGSMVVVSNYAALRALTTDFDVVMVLGRNTPDDGGYGVFEQVPFAADDDGITLNRALVTSYRRQVGAYIDPRWYGVVYGQAVVQNAAMANAQLASTESLPVRYAGPTYVFSFTFPGYTLIDVGCQFLSTSGLVTVTYDPDRVTFADGVVGLCSDNMTIAPTREVPIHTKWFTGADPQPRITGVGNVSTLILDSVVTMSANFAVDCNIDVRGSEGALIVPSSGAYSITISGGVLSAPDHRWIIATSAANVSAIDFGGSVARPEWFHEEGETNYALALAVAMKAGRVELSKTYAVSTTTTFAGAAISSAIPSGLQASGFTGPGIYMSESCVFNDTSFDGVSIEVAPTKTATFSKFAAHDCKIGNLTLPTAAGATNIRHCWFTDVYSATYLQFSFADCKFATENEWRTNHTPLVRATDIEVSNNIDVTNQINTLAIASSQDKQVFDYFIANGTIGLSSPSVAIVTPFSAPITLAVTNPVYGGVTRRTIMITSRNHGVTLTGAFWSGNATVTSITMGGMTGFLRIDLFANGAEWLYTQA